MLSVARTAGSRSPDLSSGDCRGAGKRGSVAADRSLGSHMCRALNGDADLVAGWDRSPGVDLRDAAVCRVGPALPVFASVVVIQLRVDAFVLDHVLKREPHLPTLAPGAWRRESGITLDCKEPVSTRQAWALRRVWYAACAWQHGSEKYASNGQNQAAAQIIIIPSPPFGA